jgi:uncharacterized protein (UPF0335 family)
MAGQEDSAADVDELDVEVGGLDVERLRAGVERIEQLEDERKGIGEDIADVFAQLKSAGFDTKAVRQILRERRQEPAEAEEQQTILDLYRRAMGM